MQLITKPVKIASKLAGLVSLAVAGRRYIPHQKGLTMNHKKIKSILDDPKELKEFAALNNVSSQAAQEILKRLLEKPDISEEVKKYIFSDERSEDFKGYVAGEEKGYKRGHEAGFVKGAFLGVLAAAGTAAAIIFGRK